MIYLKVNRGDSKSPHHKETHFFLFKMVSFESLVFYAFVTLSREPQASLTAKSVHYRHVRDPTCKFSWVLREARYAPTLRLPAVPRPGALFSLSLECPIPYSVWSPFECHLTREDSPDYLCKITPPMPLLRFTYILAPALFPSLDQSSLSMEGGQGPFIHCYWVQ